MSATVLLVLEIVFTKSNRYMVSDLNMNPKQIIIDVIKIKILFLLFINLK